MVSPQAKVVEEGEVDGIVQPLHIVVDLHLEFLYQTYQDHHQDSYLIMVLLGSHKVHHIARRLKMNALASRTLIFLPD